MVTWIHDADAVFNWAVSHGFTRRSDRRADCPYRHMQTVILRPGARDLVILLHTHGGLPLATLGRFRPTKRRRYFINEHDVLEGIGLSRSFAERLRLSYTDDFPPWMSRGYRDALFRTRAIP